MTNKETAIIFCAWHKSKFQNQLPTKEHFELFSKENPEPIMETVDNFTKQDMQKIWSKGVQWGDANCEFGGETRLPKFDECLNDIINKKNENKD